MTPNPAENSNVSDSSDVTDTSDDAPPHMKGTTAGSLLTLPESPRWLMEKGKEGQAIAELEKLHKTKSNPNSPFIRAEAIHFKTLIDFERCLLKGYMAILKTASLRKCALCSIIS
ncbi:hypothetical protein F5B19DRAFT_497572 [Rostrohypoxylon terebratum]|nr:hypothetical protein F5B19DRAFT_497572 [Rostrohypoxylon terebratum]